jgi:hypothetical protein
MTLPGNGLGTFGSLFVRLALGTSFLSAVADIALGIKAPLGSRSFRRQKQRFSWQPVLLFVSASTNCSNAEQNQTNIRLLFDEFFAGMAGRGTGKLTLIIGGNS